MDKNFVVVAVRNLTSKAGKPFCILQLADEKGTKGDFVIFETDKFHVGDVVKFEISLNYRYQWTASLVVAKR